MKKFGTAIILAGGKSSRMGFDKQLLKIDERSLMDILILKLKKAFDEIIIVTNKPELYIGLPYKITNDIIKEKGPLGGIHAGLKLSSSKYAFVVACDMPNINIDYINFMKEKMTSHNTCSCITKFGTWVEPFSGFYSIDLIDAIEEYLKTDKRSIYGLIQKFEITYIDEDEAKLFSPNWDMFLNLNTPEDLDNYLSNTHEDWSI